MLVNSKKILEMAKAEGYALPAADFIDLDSARSYAKAAARLRQPLMLAYAQVFEDFFTLDEAAAVGKAVAEAVDVPAVLHLDHGVDIEYVKRAVNLGFTSVMIDASADSFEDNVRKTKEVVNYAHPRGVTVEAEIGHVGQGLADDSIYTTPEEAREFYEQTNVDSLAVSIGTAHGVYKSAAAPVLNFDILHEIAAVIPIPLVLHGGSGTGDENLHRCATEGITKINIYTDFLLGAMDEIKAGNPADYHALKRAAAKGMEQVMEHYYHVFSKEWRQ